MYSNLILVLLLNFAATKGKGTSKPPLTVNAIIQPGNEDSCPDENLRNSAIADIDRLLNEIDPRTRTCECGYSGAGWKRVAFLNMTDTNQSCPGEWELRTIPKRTCQRKVSRGCSVAAFSCGGASYSKVCGRIIGYQFGTTDALYGPLVGKKTPNQASNQFPIYDGGILITHGTFQRQHIWSFVAGTSQQSTSVLGCPCNIGSSTRLSSLPSWLGQDYFCDSATVTSSVDYVFYKDNPLWDGVGCNNSLTTCCKFNNPPWFCKQLPHPTSDDIEMRLCADSDSERTPIELIDIYVR